MSRKLQSRKLTRNKRSIRCFYCNKKSRMLEELHARRNKQGTSSGSCNNARQNSSLGCDGKSDSGLCSARASRRIILKGDGMPVLITSNVIMVDSGASDYMVGDRSLLRNIRQVPDIQVELPTGLRRASKQRGGLSLMI